MLFSLCFYIDKLEIPSQFILNSYKNSLVVNWIVLTNQNRKLYC